MDLQIRRLEPDNNDLIRKIEEKKENFQDKRFLKQVPSRFEEAYYFILFVDNCFWTIM